MSSVMPVKHVLLLFLPVIAAVAAQLLVWSKYYHLDATAFLRKEVVVSSNVMLRKAACMIPQGLGWCQTRASTTTTSLEGQRILVTGGTRGIGYEISKGLVERGAQQVLMVARNSQAGTAAVESILQETTTSSASNTDANRVQFQSVDLSDLEAVAIFVDQLKQQQDEGEEEESLVKFDQLILNAGYWPDKYAQSKQGHEITYAANLLGPHLLLRKLVKENLLKSNAKVILTVGELYITLKGTENLGCSSDFVYEGDGQIAYSRSKLGIMALFFHHYLQHFPDLHLAMVHPGVIDNGLVNGGQGHDNTLVKLLMIDNQAGAQTTLILATEPAKRGGYYHNCWGQTILPESDPAMNATLGLEMWESAERLIRDFL